MLKGRGETRKQRGEIWRRRSGIRQILIFLPNLLCFLTIVFSFRAHAEEITSKRDGLDVLFLVDCSGSMASNDQNRTAIEMVKAFIDTVHSDNIRIGFTAYNDKIISSSSPVSVATPSEREQLKSIVDLSVYSGNTDIGLGLGYAYGLLGKEEGRKSVIVLISDGTTDLRGSDTGRTLDISNEEMDRTVDLCKENAVPVYTVAFGRYSGNSEVLEGIAKATEAKSFAATTPESLIEIFYGIFESNLAFKIQEVTDSIYGKGVQDIRYQLTEPYLDEINVLVISPQTIGKTDVLYGEAVYDPVYLKHYAVAKISDIQENIRELTVRINTLPGQRLHVYLVSYRNLTPVMELQRETVKGRELPFSIFFKKQNGDKIIDSEFYKSFQWNVTVSKGVDDGNGRTQELHTANGVLEGGITIEESGSYQLNCTLDDQLESCYFQPVGLTVINTAPKGQLPELKGLTVLGGKRVFYLDDYFHDEDGDFLKYALKNGDNRQADISLENRVLAIEGRRPGKQTAVLQVTDEEGRILEYSYTVTVLPLLRRYPWLILALAAAAGLLIWKIFYKKAPAVEQIAEKKAQNKFTGKLNAYFTRLPEGEEEIPPLSFPLYKIKDSKVSLGALLKDFSETADRLGLDEVYLIPDENHRLILYHSSGSSIMIGNSIICRQIQYSVSYGDVIYITSPDGTCEMEVHYIAMIQ